MSEVVRTEWQRLESDGSGELFVEVAVQGGRENVGAMDAIPFERVTQTVTKLAESLGEALKSASPTKAAIELGVEFGLKEGKLVALIARGDAKANLKITLEWSKS
jgi:hypothetical protein